MIKSRSRSPIRREDRPGGEGRRRDRYEEEEGQDRRKIIHGWRTNDARGRFDARWRISEGQENGRNGIDGKTERRGRGIDGMDDKRTVTKTEQKIIPSVVIPRNGVKTEAKVELKGELCVKTEPNNSTESWESESSNKTLGGGSAWGGSSWEIPSEVKLESSELSEWAEEKKTVISPHYSFAEICDTLKEEALQNNNDLPLPVFELFLESVKGFASRRCSVNLDYAKDDERSHAVSEAKPYPKLDSRTRSLILQRVDRDVDKMEVAFRAISFFYSQGSNPPRLDEDVIYVGNDGRSYNLGLPGRQEPVWPLQIKVHGQPIVMEGPEERPSKMDTQIREMLVWIPKENVTYPCEEAILFGLKNCDERNDNIPYVEGKPLRALIKGGIRSRGPTIKEFPEDALTLHPPIQLHKWTVDVWIKFPLRGLGPDKVLIGPDNCKLGMHSCKWFDSVCQILIKNRKYVGCEVPITEDEDDGQEMYWPTARNMRDRMQRSLNNKWLPKNKFAPACRIDINGNAIVKRLDKIPDGWHRLTVTCPGDRQLFYLDGFNIGATKKTPHAPMERIGNRIPHNCGIGAIARLKIFDKKLSEDEVERLCGAVGRDHAVEIDRTNDPTFEERYLGSLSRIVPKHSY